MKKITKKSKKYLRNFTTGMKILAIETSADDTGIAILEATKTKDFLTFKILANKVHSQIGIHTEYGGIFPMMAKREHSKNIGPLFELAMKKAKNPVIDAIAVTVGPGLEPALWVGITFAEELAKKLGVPVIPVNHMEGHILSVLVQKNKTFEFKKDTLQFPVLSLLVSGGHTELVLLKEFGKYNVIGSTRDDAAGEAFDKVARMLGLPYPGGPEISRLAEMERKRLISLPLSKGEAGRGFLIKNPSSILPLARGGGTQIQFPRPMIHSKDYNFSFSGLKTAVLYHIRDHGPLTEEMKSKIAREFEDAVVEVLISKTLRAVTQYKAKTLIIGGGVSANKQLQKMLKKKLRTANPETTLHFPTKNLSTDNALMIAIAGYFQYQKKKPAKKSQKLKAIGNLAL